MRFILGSVHFGAPAAVQVWWWPCRDLSWEHSSMNESSFNQAHMHNTRTHLYLPIFTIIYIYLPILIFTYIYLYITYIYLYLPIYIDIHIRTCTCTHMCAAYFCECAYVSANVYECIVCKACIVYIYIHTHRHLYRCVVCVMYVDL